MKITVEQFGELEFSFSYEETNSEFETHENPVGYDDETGETIVEPYFSHFRAGYVTATNGDIKIIFPYVANGGTRTYEESFDFDISIETNADFEVNGLVIVDEDGDEVDIDYEIIEKFKDEKWRQLVRNDLPEPEIEDIDNDEEAEMETITLKRDNDKDVRFTGELIASIASSPNNAGSNWSRQTGRWSELRLYKTAGGKFVAGQVGRTQWQGEHDRYSAAVCETEGEIIDFFGNGWLAKDLYDEAGIECVEDVE